MYFYAQITAVAGGAGSLGLMLYAGRHNPSRILALLFAVWVLSPFAAAVWANAAPRRWAPPVTLAVTLASLAIYTWVAFGHPAVKIGSVFLMVPLASWVVGAIGWLTNRLLYR